MTNAEMQKTMEFIVNQEAQSSAKIDALAEAQTRNTEGIRALLSIAEIHEREIATLGDKIAQVGEKIAQVGQRIAEVSENGRATDERLSALINTVERQISEGRNGKP